jgi:hypothetical protein
MADRSAALDMAALGLATPLRLLPASDARLRRTAEALLENNQFRGDPEALTTWSDDPDRPDAMLAPTDSHRDDMSCQATLWMARYLLELGRETGEGTHWTRAVGYLEAMVGRLSPLGNTVWAGARAGDNGSIAPRWLHGVWGVHGSMIETLLQLAGLDYEGLTGVVTLRPALPPKWPVIGLNRVMACGRLAYRLERSTGGQVYRLALEADLNRPVALAVDVTCPGTSQLGPWSGVGSPSFDAATGRLRWDVELPGGLHALRWTGGVEEGETFSGD